MFCVLEVNANIVKYFGRSNLEAAPVPDGTVVARECKLQWVGNVLVDSLRDGTELKPFPGLAVVPGILRHFPYAGEVG